MGMNFSPMYQPVSTKTIKADGDLNINPYDLLATDVKCDTVEASEFVGGSGNLESLSLNSDLDIGQYDVIATDVKCDTVEASEFVGGVGNFSSTRSTVFKYTGLLTTDITSSSPIATIASISTGTFSGNAMQNIQNFGSVPEYPTIAGLFDISEAGFDGDFYLRFTCKIAGSSNGTTMGIYKNSVRQTTVVFNANENSKTVSIKVPYGDKSIWGYKYESGFYTSTSSYSMSLNAIDLYPVFS